MALTNMQLNTAPPIQAPPLKSVVALRPSPGEESVAHMRLLMIGLDAAAVSRISSARFEELSVLTARDLSHGLDVVHRHKPHIVVLDLEAADAKGFEAVTALLDVDPGLAVIVVASEYSPEAAVQAIRSGAYDYLQKPLNAAKLQNRVGALLADARQRKRTCRLDDELLHAYEFESMVGRSPAMLEVFSKVRRIAPLFRTVLVAGETGTGKELVARALHRLSPGAAGPFVPCNCAAVVETLFESELFGYTRGAFTGAKQDKMGLIEYAGGGTLFLDEISEMPLGAQAKLLRFLQNQEVQCVGSPGTRRVDLRVIAASNRNLRALAARNEFREDLYYRLSMIELELPNLAQRKEDLPMLQRHFLEVFAARYRKPISGITRRAQALLAAYSWPGNVRELENILGYASLMTEKEIIDIPDLPEQIREPLACEEAEEECLTLAEMEQRHVRRVLGLVSGNRMRAAELLGVSRATLYRLLAEQKNGKSNPETRVKAPPARRSGT